MTAATREQAGLKLALLLPVYNDWECAARLLKETDASLTQAAGSIHVLLVDDCSSQALPDKLLEIEFRRISCIEHLRLRRNLGHQRAIAIGLSQVFEHCPCDAVLVMDADGEDRPEDAARLVERLKENGGRKVVFAERTRRSENWIFRVCYLAYRFAHRILTGIPVKFGNFSIVPHQYLASLVVVSETWNHYAASILRARIPFESTPTIRGNRYAGESKLNFVSLVGHGLSAISVFAETVSIRVILAILSVVVVACALLLMALGIRFFTDLAIPGWTTNVAGFLLVIVLQMLTVAVSLTLSVFFSRNTLSFLPIRDYRHFIGEVRTLYERGR